MGFNCYYEVLSVAQDADASTIKKAHRKLVVKLHPDKNLGDDDAAEKFREVQEAYECLSDAGERRWYDEHRDALLKGWSPGAAGFDGDQDGSSSMLFDLVPFMHMRCYTGFDDDDEKSFYAIYRHVFMSLAKEETDAVDFDIESNEHEHLPTDFGNSQTDPAETAKFYSIWEGFVSQQNFSWADEYDLKEADNRRVRRAMEDENKKKRKVARKARNEDVVDLVRFCKRRDPRMEAWKEQQEQEKATKEKEQIEAKRLQKIEKQKARDEWRQQAEEEMDKAEEMDKLAGRVRLADLEDDYDYSGGKKKGKKGKKNKKNQQQQQDEEREVLGPPLVEEHEEGNEGEESKAADGDDGSENAGDEGRVAESGDRDEQNPSVEEKEDQAEIIADNYCTDEDESEEESSSEEKEPDVWKCECCRKDFKSAGQMENHMKSKKHKEAYKKFQKRLETEMMAS